MSRHGRRRAMVAALAAAFIGAGLVTTVVRARGGAPASAAGAVVEAPAIVEAPAALLPANADHDCGPVTTTPPPPPQSLPGHIESLDVGGHAVLVDVPGAYAVLPATRFPVVYFLHGSPGAAADWIGSGSSLPIILDNLYRNGQLMPMIAVFPDDQGITADDSWWGDDAIGDAVESWLVGDLVPTVDTRYRTMGAPYRGIAGLSAGGFGAVNISIHHPGLFSWVASYSGVFSAPEDLFGSASAENSPQLTVAAVPAAGRIPMYVGGGAGDTEFRPDTDAFVALLHSIGWSPLDAEIVPGPHGWQAWQVEAQDSLEWLGGLWGVDLLHIPVATAVPIPRGGCPS
jgi:enterochelin esterase-like enzyme